MVCHLCLISRIDKAILKERINNHDNIGNKVFMLSFEFALVINRLRFLHLGQSFLGIL